MFRGSVPMFFNIGAFLFKHGYA